MSYLGVPLPKFVEPGEVDVERVFLVGVDAYVFRYVTGSGDRLDEALSLTGFRV